MYACPRITSPHMHITSPPLNECLSSHAHKLGKVSFSALTVRAFMRALDDHHWFERSTSVPAFGNTADMLSKSWYRTYFDVRGDKHEHR
jgi:hypothetical protein